MVMRTMSQTSKKISDIFKINIAFPKFHWNLEENMFSYFLEQFYTFIADAEVKNDILKPNPVPSSVPTPAHLDEFLRGVLEDNNNNFQFQQDKLLQKLQQKLLNIMRPLSKTW